jgi:hypothetical protein
MQTEVKVLSVFLVPYTIPPFGTVIPDWAARSTDELSIVYRLDNNTIKLHHRVPIAEKQRAAAMVKKMNAVLAAKQATTAPPQQPVPWQRSPSAAEFAQIAAQQEAERIKQETLQKQKEEEEQKQHVAAIQQHHDWLVRRAYNEFNDWCEENGSYWMAQKYQQSGAAWNVTFLCMVLNALLMQERPDWKRCSMRQKLQLLFVNGVALGL